MVHRYHACYAIFALLILSCPASARTLPRFVVGRITPPEYEHSPVALSRSRGSGVRERSTSLRLDRRSHLCLVPTSKDPRGAWGLNAVMKHVRDLRGGGDDPSDDLDDDFDDLDDDYDAEEGLVDEQDFGEANFVDRLKQEWKKTPIITRTFFQVSMGMAMFCALFNENQWPSLLLLDWRPAILKLQFWRLFAPFLYLGPVGLNFVLTAHFTWTYMSQLEKLHYREPHTFVMLLAFGMGSLLLLTLLTGGDVNSSYTLGHSLSCFMVMVWSRKFAGTKVNILDMFELPTELLPYFFVAQTLMMEGVIPWVDLSGLLIGYAWQTLSLKGLLRAPKPLVNLFRSNAFLRAEYARAGKEYGQEMPPPEDEGPLSSASQAQELDEEDEQEPCFVEEEAGQEKTVGADSVRIARHEGRPQSSEEEEEEELGTSDIDEGSEDSEGDAAASSLLEEDDDLEELDGVDEEMEIESVLDEFGDDFDELDLDDDDFLDEDAEDYINGSLED